MMSLIKNRVDGLKRSKVSLILPFSGMEKTEKNSLKLLELEASFKYDLTLKNIVINLKKKKLAILKHKKFIF